MRQRPAHLRRRQVNGQAFGEAATLIRTQGAFQNGVWTEAETPQDISCATAPMSGTDARAAELTEGGVQLSAVRLFWLSERVVPASDNPPSAGDLIVYKAERFRVRGVAPWEDDFFEAVGVRQDDQ